MSKVWENNIYICRS